MTVLISVVMIVALHCYASPKEGKYLLEHTLAYFSIKCYDSTIPSLSNAFSYFAFGLHIAFELDSPELLPVETAAPDVHVRLSAVSDTLPISETQRVLLQAAPDHLLLVVDGVGRCLVSKAMRSLSIAPQGLRTRRCAWFCLEHA